MLWVWLPQEVREWGPEMWDVRITDIGETKGEPTFNLGAELGVPGAKYVVATRMGCPGRREVSWGR